jgi:hypothetical protein
MGFDRLAGTAFETGWPHREGVRDIATAYRETDL